MSMHPDHREGLVREPAVFLSSAEGPSRGIQNGFAFVRKLCQENYCQENVPEPLSWHARWLRSCLDPGPEPRPAARCPDPRRLRADLRGEEERQGRHQAARLRCQVSE